MEETADNLICLIDNVVIGTITKNDVLISWENLLKFIQSNNHKVVCFHKNVPNNSIFNGEVFICNSVLIDNKLIEIISNNSYIYRREKPPDYIADYTLYIVDILQEILLNLDSKLNCVINTNDDILFNNSTNKIIKFGINAEQMISDYDNNGYTVVTSPEDYINSMDICIDYSEPNIFFLKETKLFDNFNIIYISPSIYKTVIDIQEKCIETISTFANLYGHGERRTKFLDNLNKPNHLNLSDCYEYNELKANLSNSKILINVHRSPHEHTFEEIRCLPALMCRTIVISENSPFTELVPYQHMIIWCDYDSLVSKTQEVLRDYEYYYNKIFTSDNITLLNDLHFKNKLQMSNILKNIK